MTQSIFKAYDIRGRCPREINKAIIYKITSGLAKNFFLAGKVVIGHDVRLTSPGLYKAVKKALLENSKIKIIEAGLMTTPMLYFLVNHSKAVGGLMITASHNPKEYNGLKAVGRKAEPVSGREIYKFII